MIEPIGDHTYEEAILSIRALLPVHGVLHIFGANAVLCQYPRSCVNGAIQFSSRDEYRYHEALTHIPLQQVDKVERVLLLGGGEGLAAREILKYPELQSLKIIDIDPAVTRISNKLDFISELNEGALQNEKVEIIHKDAFKYIELINISMWIT